MFGPVNEGNFGWQRFTVCILLEDCSKERRICPCLIAWKKNKKIKNADSAESPPFHPELDVTEESLKLALHSCRNRNRRQGGLWCQQHAGNMQGSH